MIATFSGIKCGDMPCRRVVVQTCGLALVLCFLFHWSSSAAENAASREPIAILYAFGAEGALLESRMEIDSVTVELGRRVIHGRLESRSVVLAESGIGMVNAAMTTQHLIDAYHPSVVLFSGIAGAIDSTIQIGDIVVCSTWSHHEYGYWGEDGLQLEGPELYLPGQDSTVSVALLPADTSLLQAAHQLSGDSLSLESIVGRTPRLVIGGTGASGNSFIDNVGKRVQLFRELHARVVDMESASVVQVCLINDIPCLIFRSASDLAGGSGSETARDQIQEFFKVAAENSSAVVIAFLRRL